MEFIWEDNINSAKYSKSPEHADINPSQVVLPLTQNLLRCKDYTDYVTQKKKDDTKEKLPGWMMFTKWGRRPKRRRGIYEELVLN